MGNTNAAHAILDSPLVLSGSLCVDRAQELLEQLQASALESGDTTVDAHGVSRIDTAGLQLLAVAVSEWKRRGRRWTWGRVSTPIVEAARIAGLGNALGLQPAD